MLLRGLRNLPDIIQKALSSGKIAGSWLVSGGYEFEKKSFILDVCSALFHQDFHSLDAFHPDVRWIECGLTEESKKQIQKQILAGKALTDMDDLSYKREITIEDIRAGIQFLSLKGGADTWRVLIINPADKMNENAANALLKVLEEPNERSIIFLLCQNLGKLLPTIKSRCRKIVLRPLSESDLTRQLKNLYPALTDVDLVVQLSEGSIGLAREICDCDGLGLYRQMLSLLVPADQLSVEAVKNFAAEVTENPTSFRLLKKFLSDWLMARVKQYAVTSPFIAEDYMDLHQEVIGLFQDIDRIYLDPKQVIQTIFFKIAEVLL